MDVREQACWLCLAFESGLANRIVNAILASWCQKHDRTLDDFFAAPSEDWRAICHLNIKAIKRLEQARGKLAGQISVVERLRRDKIGILTALDATYPERLKAYLTPGYIPPVLLYAGDLSILERQAIAIIGSRGANARSLNFARTAARYFADEGANVISGNARGVDRAAYGGAMSSETGHTTIVLPQGIRTLSGEQMRELRPEIETGRVLLLSQFHPNAPWLVRRAMERNHIVTGLAQAVIVAESGSRGGTWEGATSALKRERRVYVYQPRVGPPLPGNQLLLEKGALPLPGDDLPGTLSLILRGVGLPRPSESLPRPPRDFATFEAQYFVPSRNSRRIIREITASVSRLLDRTSRQLVRKSE